jgi:hypothetical protein
MAKKIATKVRAAVEHACFQLLDDWKYLNRSRNENSKFMDQLVNHKDVGRKLQEFLDIAAVRKYIKDVLVNKYAKEKRQMPRDISVELGGIINEALDEIEWVASDNLSLHRSALGIYVVAARTTYVKWETGLRKILLYICSKPALRPVGDCVTIMVLAVFEHSADINEADRKELGSALGLIGVKVFWGT